MARSDAVQASGITAEAVAEGVFEGMLADRFYIFPDAWAHTFVRSSLEPAITAQNPEVRTWGADLRSRDEQTR